MDVMFLSFDFERLLDVSKPVSVNIEKKYCGFGCAELHFAINECSLIQLLEENEYLFFTVAGHSAIVTGWQLGEDIAVYGRTPEWLLTRRGIEPISFSAATGEEIVRSMVEGVADFVQTGEPSGVGEAMDYSTEEVRSLYDLVCEVLRIQGLGFEVVADMTLRAFVFKVYKGGETLCMLSPASRTAYDMRYSVEKQDMATGSGWYKRRYKDMGGWDAVANSPTLTNNQPSNAYTFYKVTSDAATSRFDLPWTRGAYIYCDNDSGKWRLANSKPDHIWLYIDNPSLSGLKKWDSVLTGSGSLDEAKAELMQRKTRTDLSCEAHHFELGEDYCLGDVVRVQLEFDEFKKTEKKRVASVNIYYDTNMSGIAPVLESMEE